MSHFFAMLSRMKYINRWGLMRNTRNETICEHSLDTAILAHALAVLRNRRFGGNVNPEKAALLAIFHDAAEIRDLRDVEGAGREVMFFRDG